MFRSTLCIASNTIRMFFGKEVPKTFLNVFDSKYLITNKPLSLIQRNYTLLGNPQIIKCASSCFLQPSQEHKSDFVRSVTKFSLQSGKRKSVKAVLNRFYRLDWGMWIRGKCGRQKKLHKKSANLKRRLRQHVFTNATQSWLLDKMVTRYWRKPKYYIDDPYEPYHMREEFPHTRKKPYVSN